MSKMMHHLHVLFRLTPSAQSTTVRFRENIPRRWFSLVPIIPKWARWLISEYWYRFFVFLTENDSTTESELGVVCGCFCLSRLPNIM